MRAVVQYETVLTGDVLYVTPLSAVVLQRIVQAAEDLLPFDETPFEEPLENSAIADDVYVDRDSPEYQAALGRNRQIRDDWMLNRLYGLAVDAEKKDDIVKAHAGLLSELHSAVGKKQSDDNAWIATLRYFVLANPTDEKAVMQIIRGQAPLSDAEVIDGMRVFRTSLPEQISS
jgi:hypothetical protein